MEHIKKGVGYYRYSCAHIGFFFGTCTILFVAAVVVFVGGGGGNDGDGAVATTVIVMAVVVFFCFFFFISLFSVLFSRCFVTLVFADL